MNIGIIGLGFMGATHATKYASMAGVRIGAVCARDEAKLSGKFSMQSGNLDMPLPDVDLSGAAKYKDWIQLVSDPQVDAVDICGPSDLHCEMALAALAKGKHVLCEKPMALTVADCDRMLAAVNETKRCLMIAHVLRFWPEYAYLRDWLRARKTSELQRVRFSRQCGTPTWGVWQTSAVRSGGALLDLLIHDLDQILLLFGRPVSVTACGIGEHDAVQASLRYGDGLVVELDGGWLKPGTAFSMGFSVESADAALRFEGNVLTENGQRASLPQGDAFERELAYFVECCESGAAPDLCPPAASRTAVELALLLNQSRSTGGTQIACEA